MAQMKSRLVTLVGKVENVDNVDEGYFTLLTTDDRQVSVIGYEPSGDDQSQLVQNGDYVEVRGLVKDATVLQYNRLKKYESERDL